MSSLNSASHTTQQVSKLTGKVTPLPEPRRMQCIYILFTSAAMVKTASGSRDKQK